MKQFDAKTAHLISCCEKDLFKEVVDVTFGMIYAAAMSESFTVSFEMKENEYAVVAPLLEEKGFVTELRGDYVHIQW